MKENYNKHFKSLSANSIFMLTICLSLGACNSESAENTMAENNDNVQIETKQITKEQNNPVGNIMTLQGQVLYQRFEGGFFGFVAANGDKYLPYGLSKEFKKNGLIIEIKAQKIENLLTTQQYGETIKVLEAKVLDSSKVTSADDTF